MLCTLSRSMRTFSCVGWRGFALASALGGLINLCGCNATGPSCNSILAAAVIVTVTDSTGRPVCDVTVQIQGAQGVAQYSLTSETCYAAAGAEDGDYGVSVSRSGSELAQQMVRVGFDECGPVQEKVVVRLP
jgi:hypothetical protein